MIRRFPLFFAFLLLALSPAIYSQSDPSSQSDSGSTDQQGQSPRCTDGSLPTYLEDGNVGCQTLSPQGTGGASGSSNRATSSLGAAENTSLGGQSKTASSQRSSPLPPEPLTEFQKFVAATTGQLLPIYGVSLFRNIPSTFSPNDLAPVTSDYVLGPDDEVRIRIWGQVSFSGNIRVDRSGDIYLPEVGSVHVAGLEFSALDQQLRKAVSRVYRNFDLSVGMGRIRSMQIYITGQARRPGAYTVSSLSSLVDALFASGGPSAQGSFRHLELRRNGKTITDFDLYALLIHGDKSKDSKLLPEDVLYIPATGAQVAIIGSIHNSAIYELRGAETIGDLIDVAGKTSAIASNARISLERVGEHQVRQAMEFPLDASGLAAPLVDGDILRVYSIVPNYQKTVTLRGDVANPGRFAWHAGMHLSDLIPDKDSLLSRDYWWKRSHLGLPTPEFEPFLSNFEAIQRIARRRVPTLNTGNSTGTNSNTPSSNNSITVLPDPEPLDFTSPSSQDALTLSLNATLAANDRQETGTDNTDQSNERPSGSGGTVASQYSQMSGPGSLPSYRKTSVGITAPEIDWNYAVIERLDPETLRTTLIPFDLGKLVLNHDTAQNLALQPGDTITVFSQADIRVPLEEQTKYVKLEGEFVHSGVYSVRPGETLRDLVRRAGGITSKAYLYGSEFDRESTRVLQQQRIDEYIRRVDLDAGRGALALTASGSNSAPNTAAATAAEHELIYRLKEIRATGRVVLRFQANSISVDDIPAISLENGDRFVVPPMPATINVVGAVYDQSSFLYSPGGTAGRYLRIAGGPDRDADSRRTFVIRADGSVIGHQTVKNAWGNTFKDLKLYPGDTIVVPDKVLRPNALRGLIDWSQIFSQLAFGAAAISVLQ